MSCFVGGGIKLPRWPAAMNAAGKKWRGEMIELHNIYTIYPSYMNNRIVAKYELS